MEIKKVALVIFDIGGYTEFIRYHKDSLAHAHEVISQLLESIVEHAEYPLILNKFEGDAALLYAEIGDDERRAVGDIYRQVSDLFPAFKAKALELSNERSMCPCGACQNIRELLLKAIVHRGEAAFRKIRQFDEMAGQDVILVHRLLKNSVNANEYILVTEAFYSLLDDNLASRGQALVERYDHLGEIKLKAFPPSGDQLIFRGETSAENWWRRLLARFGPQAR